MLRLCLRLSSLDLFLSALNNRWVMFHDKTRFRIFMVASAVLFALVLWSVPRRLYDPDELEHLRVGRAVDKGWRVYRDIFEHHMPLQYVFLSPLHRLTGDVPEYLSAGRFLAAILSCVTLVLVYAVARRYGSSGAAWCSVALTAMSYVFLQKSWEIRPDNMMLPSLLGVVLCLEAAVDGARNRIFAAGFLTALSVVASVKGAVCAAALIPLLFFRNSPERLSRGRQAPLKILLLWIGTTAGWLTAAAVISWRMDILEGLIQFNILDNARWTYHFPWTRHMKEILFHDPVLTALAGAGWIVTLLSAPRRLPPPPWFISTCLFALPTLIVPNPYLQNFLPLLPFAFMTAAPYLLSDLGYGSGNVTRRDARHSAGIPFFVLWSGGAALVSIYFLLLARPAQWAFYEVLRWLHTGNLVMVLSVPLLYAAGRRRGAARLAAAMLLVWPAANVMLIHAQDNTAQVQSIMAVRRMVPPDGTVLDGWTGKGVLCDPAGFFPFIHIGLMSQYGDRIRKDVRKILETHPPDIILLDADMLGHSLSVLGLVKKAYVWDSRRKLWAYRPEEAKSQQDKPALRPERRRGFDMVLRRWE